MVNYGLYNILSTYVKAPSEAYAGVQWSIIYIIVIIAVVTVIMLAIIPKENINEILESMENPEKSPEQQLRNITDEDLTNSENDKK